MGVFVGTGVRVGVGVRVGLADGEGNGINCGDDVSDCDLDVADEGGVSCEGCDASGGLLEGHRLRCYYLRGFRGH